MLNKLWLLLAGLKVPRYDRLQDTMQSLVDNLSLFNYRELLVRALCRQQAAWLLCTAATPMSG